MTRKLISTLAALFILLTGSGQSIDDLGFLTGTWKVDGKETYEVWEKVGKELKGNSYKIKNGEKVITENLSLITVNENVVYEATVLNQNEGKPVPFTLNPKTEKGYSFENPAHDFPAKIIYQKISDTELVVQVLGSDDKGFTINFKKQ